MSEYQSTPGEWDPAGGEPGVAPGAAAQRYVSALKRFKWLIASFVVLGAAAGVVATRFIAPLYLVQATVTLNPTTREQRGPSDNLQRSGYLDMLVSFGVVDPVVEKLRLFVSPLQAADSALFTDFSVAESSTPGDYELEVTGSKYELRRQRGLVVEEGTLGDSVGRSVGFGWLPDAVQLRRRKSIMFTVRTPREVSVRLKDRMTPRLIEGSNFLTMTFADADAHRAAQTLNTWAESFVTVATQLKRFQVERRAEILDGQLEFARNELGAAEKALEDYRVKTATLPSESRIPQAVGTQLMQDPVFTAYSSQQVVAQSLRRDRDAIARAATADNGLPSAEGLYAVPTVATDAAATQLRQQIDEVLRREQRLRELRQRFTEEWSAVVQEREALEQLRSREIPVSVRGLLAQLDGQINTVNGELTAKESDLQGIPKRTLELGRLTRKLDVEDERYRTLLQTAQNARLDEMTTPPDIQIYDRAVAPLKPARNQAPILIGGATAAALFFGIGLALLLDRLDKRFRYPQQATEELRLFILGVIPNVKRRKRRSFELDAQMVEAFRAVRMNLRYSVDPSRPFSVTVTSPGPGDGKSFVSANLALSFAESGLRVLLIDGDLRRGTLHNTFNAEQQPGLLEYLDGTALLPEVLRASSHNNLTVLPSGRRARRAPELLTGPRLTQLIAQLGLEYDVIIVDSPPLGAGADAYSLGIATENLVMVLRAGVTDRKLGAAKMRVLETLPIRVLGGILNGIDLNGIYQYYDYYLDYASEDEPVKSLPTAGSSADRSTAVARS